MQIGVDETTLYNWERQRTVPEIRYMPKIITFLGYDPGHAGSSSAEQIRAHRIALGLSLKKAAMLLGIDPGTLQGWETGRHKPSKQSTAIISTFLGRTI